MHLSVQQRCIPKDDRRGNWTTVARASAAAEGIIADAREGPMEGKKERRKGRAGSERLQSRETGCRRVCGNKKEQEKRVEKEGTGCWADRGQPRFGFGLPDEARRDALGAAPCNCK